MAWFSLSSAIALGLMAQAFGSDAQIALIRGALTEAQDPTGEGPAASRAFSAVARALERACIGFEVLPDDTLEAEKLSGRRLAILAYSPRLNPPARAALLRYIGSGGRLLVFYSADPALWPALGIKTAKHRPRARAGEFSEIRFLKDAIPFAPESIAQDSWNVLEVVPAAGAKVLATWHDERRMLAASSLEPGGTVPAVVRGPAGALVTHVLLSPVTDAKSQMVLALAAELAGEALLEPVVCSRLEKARQTPLWNGLSGLAALARSIDDPHADRAGILEALDRAARAERDALAALEVGSFGEALRRAMHAEGASKEAAARTLPARDGEIRAIWVRYPENVDWAAAAPRLAQAGFNVVMPNYIRGLRSACGGRGGELALKAMGAESIPKAEPAPGSLQTCISECRRAGLEVHLWWTVLFLDDTRPEQMAGLAQAGRLMQTPGGSDPYTKGRSGWLCPSHPDNIAMLREAAAELVQRWSLSGLHLDYIRFPAEDVCTCESCRRASQIGGKWPEDVLSGGPKWPEFRAFRRARITDAVEAIAGQARKARPGIFISAAVFPEPALSRETLGQDWPAWVERGLLDFVVPMNYTSSSEELARWVREQSERIAGRVPLVSGLGVSAGRVTLDDPAELLQQISTSRKSGADGYAIFQMDSEFMERHLPLVAAGPGRTGSSVRPHGAPAIDWTLKGPLIPGAAAELWLKVGKSSPTGLQVSRFGGILAGQSGPRVELESVDGRPIAELGPGPGAGEETAIPFTVPAGTFRVVLRGTVDTPLQSSRPVAVRSPLFIVKTADERDSESARKAPPTGLPRVAVLEGGYGSHGILACLRRKGEFGAYPVSSLRELAGPDGALPAALIVTQRRDPGSLDDAAKAALRLFVEAGGGVLLTHDACGYRYHPRLFPEVVRRCVSHEAETQILPEPGGPLVRELGDAPIEHAHYDHVILEPGDSGVVVARGRSGPAVVWGEAGKGRVVACGIALGINRDERESAPEHGEAELLFALVRYLLRAKAP